MQNFQRFPDANQAFNDLDDRKADRPLSVYELPTNVVNGSFVCVDAEGECRLYFGAVDKWRRVMLVTED